MGQPLFSLSAGAYHVLTECHENVLGHIQYEILAQLLTLRKERQKLKDIPKTSFREVFQLRPEWIASGSEH